MNKNNKTIPKTNNDETFGNLMLVIPICIAFFSFNLLIDIAKLKNAVLILKGIGFITIYITAILATIEKSKIEKERKIGPNITIKKRWGPIAWFIFISLLWIIGYPAYLYNRSNYGLKNRLGAAIIIIFVFCLIFALSFYYLHLIQSN